MYSLWCSLKTDDTARYQSVISSLTKQQGGALFPPHMTLGSFSARPDLSSFRLNLPEISAEAEAIARTDSFTMSLFVRLKRNSELDELRDTVEAHPMFRPGRVFDPHISLCYGAPPHGSEARSDVLALLDRPVVLKRLTLIELSLPVSTYADVAKWQVCDEVLFA